jgi:hypothetical protein
MLRLRRDERMKSNYCKYCKDYVEKHEIIIENDEEYILCTDTCKQFPNKKIDEYDENKCYEEEKR